MAFAIFYNPDDLAPLVAALQDARVAGQDRQMVNRIWGGGLSGWQTAPQAPVEYQSGDPGTRIVIISDPQVTLQQMRDLMYRQSAALGVPLLSAIADDMAHHDGAKEPWP